jgi:glucokinase
MGFLAVDVGGTKTQIAYFEKGRGENFAFEKRYESKNYQALEAIIDDFIATHAIKPKNAAIGVAGPVIQGVCHTTNLPWIVDGAQLKERFNLSSCEVMNDIVANAYGINVLTQEQLIVLQPGRKITGNRALIAAGTGLGEAGIYFDSLSYHPFPTEGGHCDFAPQDDEEVDLLIFLKKRHGHVSYERVLSGGGVLSLYEFYTECRNLPKVAGVEASSREDQPKMITQLGLAGEKTCQTVIDRFVTIYAAEAGNLALKIYATGGLYIGGGIAPKIIHALKQKNFIEAFCDKGRFKPWMEGIPIYVIQDEKTALRGAAYVASR